MGGLRAASTPKHAKCRTTFLNIFKESIQGGGGNRNIRCVLFQSLLRSIMGGVFQHSILTVSRFMQIVSGRSTQCAMCTIPNRPRAVSPRNKKCTVGRRGRQTRSTTGKYTLRSAHKENRWKAVRLETGQDVHIREQSAGDGANPSGNETRKRKRVGLPFDGSEYIWGDRERLPETRPGAPSIRDYLGFPPHPDRPRKADD